MAIAAPSRLLLGLVHPHLPATMMIVVATTADSWGTMLTSAHALDSNISKIRGKALRLEIRERNKLCK
jgi:hypothetical protein